MAYSLLTVKHLCQTTREKGVSFKNLIGFFGDFPEEGRFALVFHSEEVVFPTFSLLFFSKKANFFFTHQG